MEEVEEIDKETSQDIFERLLNSSPRIFKNSFEEFVFFMGTRAYELSLGQVFNIQLQELIDSKDSGVELEHFNPNLELICLGGYCNDILVYSKFYAKFLEIPRGLLVNPVDKFVNLEEVKTMRNSYVVNIKIDSNEEVDGLYQ